MIGVLAICATPRSADARALFVVADELLALLGSVTFAPTFTPLLNSVTTTWSFKFVNWLPGLLTTLAGTFTTMVTVAVPLFAREPSVQVVVPPQAKEAEVTDCNVTPAGKMSVRFKFAAGNGPALVTVMVYAILSPVRTSPATSARKG